MKKANWEGNIKELFNERAIEPSVGSWQTLSERLDAAQSPKRKPYVWYVGIAASVAAILFATTFFLNRNAVQSQKTISVDTQEPIDKQTIEKMSSKQDHAVAKHEENVKNTKQTQTEDHVQGIKNKDVMTSSKHQPSYSSNNKRVTPMTPLAPKEQLDSVENILVSEIVAQIEVMKRNGQLVTDADIDLLLAKAQKTMKYQYEITESHYVVDANALLWDVETDLQESFRNKIFEALKNSYETVRTAVVQRNH